MDPKDVRIGTYVVCSYDEYHSRGAIDMLCYTREDAENYIRRKLIQGSDKSWNILHIKDFEWIK